MQLQSGSEIVLAARTKASHHGTFQDGSHDEERPDEGTEHPLEETNHLEAAQCDGRRWHPPCRSFCICTRITALRAAAGVPLGRSTCVNTCRICSWSPLLPESFAAHRTFFYIVPLFSFLIFPLFPLFSFFPFFGPPVCLLVCVLVSGLASAAPAFRVSHDLTKLHVTREQHSPLKTEAADIVRGAGKCRAGGSFAYRRLP